MKYDYYGRRLATCSMDGSIKIYEENNVLSSSLASHSGAVHSVSWSHPKFSVLLASGGSDHRAIIWKEASYGKWAIIYDFIGHNGPITSVEWGPYQHGPCLLVGSLDGCISLLKALNEDRWECRTTFAHFNGVLSVSWAPVFAGLLCENIASMSFATAGADNIVKVWNFDNDFECTKLEKHKAWVRALCWGDKLFSGSEDGSLVLWEDKQGWKGREIYHDKNSIWSISFNENGTEILISCGNNSKVLKETNGSFFISSQSKAFHSILEVIS